MLTVVEKISDHWAAHTAVHSNPGVAEKQLDEKQWLKEKQRAVVDARVQEKRATDKKQKQASANIYGRDEIYQRSRKDRAPHVSPSCITSWLPL